METSSTLRKASRTVRKVGTFSWFLFSLLGHLQCMLVYNCVSVLHSIKALCKTMVTEHSIIGNSDNYLFRCNNLLGWFSEWVYKCCPKEDFFPPNAPPHPPPPPPPIYQIMGMLYFRSGFIIVLKEPPTPPHPLPEESYSCVSCPAHQLQNGYVNG